MDALTAADCPRHQLQHAGMCRRLTGQTVALLLMGLPQNWAISAAVKLPQVPAFTKALMMQSFHWVSSSWLRPQLRVKTTVQRAKQSSVL